MQFTDGRQSRGGNGAVCRAIKEHFDILEYMQGCGYQFKEKGNSFQCVEHESLWVTPSEGLFVWHSQRKGGSIIDFVMMHDSLSQADAISRLRLEMSGNEPQRPPHTMQASKPRRELTLPAPIQGKYSRVFAYLTKTRGIDSAIVADVVKRKMLYEDAKYHNCIFVGHGENGEPSYASFRATSEKKLVMDLPGSKKTGWFVDNKSPALFVVEAPIDALSIMTLLKLGGKDYTRYSYLAQGGSNATKALRRCLLQNPNTERLYLCYDNDTAGRLAAQAAKEMCREIGFGGGIVDKLPIGNDFNDDLKAHVSRPKQNYTKNTMTQEAKLCFAR